MDEIALGNYIATHILDPVRRVDGVGEADEFGTEYATRIWMDPAKLNSFNLTAGVVVGGTNSASCNR
jgi:multidrug efflux pump subunit AcrB